jgi:hypothetical protein
MNKIMDELMNQMPFDQLIEAMVPAYQKHFTKGDMEALTAFYSSPTGQKILQELPAITSESMQTALPIMRKNIEQMQGRVHQEIPK